MSRAVCRTSAAAAAISGAAADVPPLSTTATESAFGPRCSNAGMLSPGADSVTRCPQPLAKSALPSVRVSAYVGFRQALPPSCGETASVSSAVVAPASIEPLSTTSLGVVEDASSLMLVAWAGVAATLVGVAPPSGPIAVGVYSRVPSFAASTTVIP